MADPFKATIQFNEEQLREIVAGATERIRLDAEALREEGRRAGWQEAIAALRDNGAFAAWQSTPPNDLIANLWPQHGERCADYLAERAPKEVQ